MFDSTIKKIFYMLRPQVSQAASLRKHGFSNMTFGLNDKFYAREL